MSKHTPGPWHRNVKPATKYNTVWSGRNKHVARVVVEGLDPEEVEANIRLIAAAPDLLEALQTLLVDGRDYTKARDKARAAIVKATWDGA